MASESYQSDPAPPGNEFFVQKEYEKAVEAYSTAIEKYPDMAKLYSNRAMSYLKLERPYLALKDLEIGLKLDQDNDKMIYRMCKALLALRRFPDAGQLLEESIARLEQLTKDNAFKALIADINRLKVEYERGQYDLLAMIDESKKSNLPDNHADYFASNKYEIRKVDGKGRGLVAKAKIKAGELLIASKALFFVESESEGAESMDLINRGMGVLSIAPEIWQICNKLSNRPDLAKKFYRLYAGPKLGHLENWTKGKSELIDRNRIESIIRYNQLGTDIVFDRAPTIGPPIGGFGGGLWLVPSYINHTCADANCTRCFVGDYIFVRATKSIEKDEEILFPYVPSGSSFEKRRSACRDYGFDCQCRLCAMDRRDPIETRQRMETAYKFMDNLDAMTQELGYVLCDIPTLRNLLQQLLHLRPQRDSNYLALRVQIDLADLIYPVDAKESLRLLTEAFDICKSFGDFRGALQLSRSKMLHRTLRVNGGRNEQKKWDCETRRLAKLIYGDERMANVP